MAAAICGGIVKSNASLQTHVRFLSFALLIFISSAQGPPKSSKGNELMTLAESDFLWDDDNWTVTGNASDFQHSNRMIKATDDGPDEWYFVAPGKFLGSKRAAYGGKLSFKHGLFEYNSEGRDVQRDAYDVILFSEAYELVIGYRNLFPAWEFRSEHSLDLDETAGWISNTTGTPPSRPDMVRVLTKLSGMWIRGGMYYGHEDSYIMSVTLQAGPVDSAPKATSLKKQKILSPDPRLAEEIESRMAQTEIEDVDSAPSSEKTSSRTADAPPPPSSSDDEESPPPPPAEDDDLPTLDSDMDDAPKQEDKKKSGGMFGSMFGSSKKKGKDEF